MKSISIIRKIPGKPGIRCLGRMKRRTPTMSLTLRVPPALYHRLHKMVDGYSTVAAWALIESALDQIDAGSEKWIIELPSDNQA